MIEIDVECGHTKTTLHATFSHLNSSNLNDNFKDNFIWDKVKSTMVILFLSFRHSCFFIIFTFGSVIKLLFDNFFYIAFGYTITL